MAAKDFVLFLAILMCFVLAAQATDGTASEDDVHFPYGCNEVDETSDLVANYNGNTFDDTYCGTKLSVTYGGNEITVTLVGECVGNCPADIILSNDSYDEIGGDSDVLTVNYEILTD